MAQKKKNKRPGLFGRMFGSIKHYTTSERVHFIIGLLIFFVVVYVGIAMISFLFTGKSDQSVVDNIHINNLLSAVKEPIENWAGVRGAYFSDTIIDRWFGLPAFFALFFFGSLGFRLMKLCPMHLFSRFLLCSTFMIWTSLLLTMFFGNSDILFFNIGGRHGKLLYDWLHQNIGFIGVLLVLIAGIALTAIFISNRTVPFLRRKMQIGYKKYKSETYEIEEEDTEDEEPEDEEDTEKYDTANDEDGDDEETDGFKTDDDDFNVRIADDDDDVANIAGLGNYDPRLDLSYYKFPDINLLKKYEKNDTQVDMDEQYENKNRIKKTLSDFGINITSINATVGPTVTLYEVVPDKGVKISKIRSLEDDIALSLSALGIRIIAPIPGKGTVGIEVPNKRSQIVSMESVVKSSKFIESKYELPIVLGRTITNEIYMFDLTKMPHLLVAGATGMGKSVCLNVIMASLLYKKHPAELKFVLIDPKRVEFSIYKPLEHHYLAKLPEMDDAIITDTDKAIRTLKSLCKEMEDRYDLLTKAHVRKISEYNEKFINRQLNPNNGHKYMPYIVVIVDEYGDLMMTSGKEIEMPIARIAQKARAVGIHMIIATQRPSANVVTGIIKANFPARIAFKVTQMVDSRVILDSAGANKLIGRGDLLFSQGNDITRVQCSLIETNEIESISDFISKQQGYPTAYELPEPLENAASGEEGTVCGNNVGISSLDPMFEKAARLIVTLQSGSTSMIQRKLELGYNRAGRIMDQMEAAGIVGAAEGSKPRQVLIMDEYALEKKLNELKGN